MTMRKLVTLLFLTLVCAAVASLNAVGAGDPRSPAERPADLDNPQAIGGDANEELKRNFAVFRKVKRAEDEAEVADVAPGASARGANRKEGRKALTTVDGDSVFVVPIQGGVCFVSSKDRAAGCSSTANALAGLAVESIICSPALPPDKLQVTGLLPDGARDVKMVFSDGREKALAVTNNVYLIVTDRKAATPRLISWVTDEGSFTTGTTVPSDAAESRCAE